MISGVGKAAVVGLGAAATAFGALSIKALQMGGDLEQSLGGIETLFKDSADIVIANAERAYLTAGVNANDYMQQVTSFSASLLSSLGGDTEAAAAAADMAVIDMADNANKMGTAIESIQIAYQGFAKGNYGMLDNLKLGFGGTKEEMQRLLEEAGKISGMEYDISNLNDVYSAVHVIQDELGITGTTALEGMTTLNGAFVTAKGALSNFLSGAGDVDAVVDTFSNLADVVVKSLEELLPRLTEGVTEIAEGLLPKIPQIFAQLLPAIVQGASSLINGIINMLPAITDVFISSAPEIINAILSMAPLLLQAGVDIVTSLLSGIGSMLPELIPTAVQTIITLVQGLIDGLPLLLDAALQLIMGLADGFIIALPELISKLPAIIVSIVDFVVKSIPQIIEVGIKLLTALVGALPQIIDTIVIALPQIINGIINALIRSLPQIIAAGVTLLIALIENLPLIITTIVNAIPQIVTSISNAFIANIDKIIDAGVMVFIALIENLPQIITELIKAVPQIISSIVGALTESIPKLAEVGTQLIQGLWNGIEDMGEWLRQKISGFFGGVVDSIKDFFGIQSPSKLFEKEIGIQLPAGMAVGIEKGTPTVTKAAEKMSKKTYEKAKLWIEDYQNDTQYLASEELKMWESLSKGYAEKTKERVAIDKNIAKLREQVAKEDYENSANWIEKRKFFGLMSLKEEISAWERVQSRYLEGTEEREKADRELFTAQEKLNTERERLAQKLLDAEEKYTSELENRTQAIFTGFGVLDKWTSKEDKRQQLLDDSVEKYNKSKIALDELNSKLSENMDNEEEYQSLLEEIASERDNLTAATEEMNSAQEEANKSQAQILIDNVQSQVDAMQTLYDNLSKLEDRGLDENVLTYLQGLGTGASSEIAGLAESTDTELTKFTELFREKNELARKLAVQELEPLKKETDDIVAGLANQALALETGTIIGSNLASGITQTLGAMDGMEISVENVVTPDMGESVGSNVAVFADNFTTIKDTVLSLLSEMSAKALEILRKMTSNMDIFLRVEGYNVGKTFVDALGQALIDEQSRLYEQALSVADSIRSAFSDESGGFAMADSYGSSASGAQTNSQATGLSGLIFNFYGAINNSSQRNVNDLMEDMATQVKRLELGRGGN